MRINPYLSFDGRCREAFQFYATTFRGKIAMIMSRGESPIADQVAPEDRDGVMHAQLQIGDQVLMGADAPRGGYTRPSGGCVTINVDSNAEAERLFAALADGATVQMPIAETFWANRFGMLVDRYGTPWMINCPKSGPAG